MWLIFKVEGVKVTHIPTGVVVVCQEHRTMQKNKFAAIQELRSKLETFSKLFHNLPEHELYPETPATINSVELADATDVLLAYPGRTANESRLKVWEAMRESVIKEHTGQH